MFCWRGQIKIRDVRSLYTFDELTFVSIQINPYFIGSNTDLSKNLGISFQIDLFNDYYVISRIEEILRSNIWSVYLSLWNVLTSYWLESNRFPPPMSNSWLKSVQKLWLETSWRVNNVQEMDQQNITKFAFIVRVSTFFVKVDKQIIFCITFLSSSSLGSLFQVVLLSFHSLKLLKSSQNKCIDKN